MRCMGRLAEVITSRIDAAILKTYTDAVQTTSGETGYIIGASVFKGTVTLDVKGERLIFTANKVGTLDQTMPIVVSKK